MNLSLVSLLKAAFGQACVRLAVVTIALTLPVASFAAAGGPPQRLIIQLAPAVASESAQAQVSRQRLSGLLQRVSAAQGVALQRLRAIGTGAEVVLVAERLDATRLASLMAALREEPGVEYVEEDRLLKALFVPNDSRYNEQWHYSEAIGGIRAPAAWDQANGTGAIVAVLDTGYRPHADLAASILQGYDMISDVDVANDGDLRDSDASDPGDWVKTFECGANPPQDSSWHGTHVSGTIAALTNNAKGVAGVAYGAKILPVRVLGKCGGYTSDIADAIVWASGGSVPGVPANPYKANLISMSLGGSGACDSTTKAAIKGAISRGTAVIAAAGNDGEDASKHSPGNCPGVIAVAATTRGGGRASYSNYGSTVAIAAPGGDGSDGVLSTLNTGTKGPAKDSYAFYEGTSMATPHVAAVAALLYGLKPDLSVTQLRTALTSTARAFPASCAGCGSGIVDAAAAITYVNTLPPSSAPACPAGFTGASGTLADAGSRYLPGSKGFAVSGTSVLDGRLKGPATGVDFDLYLQQLVSGSWTTVAQSRTPSVSGEFIRYTNAAAGTYRWRLRSVSGAGTYGFCSKTG